MKRFVKFIFSFILVINLCFTIIVNASQNDFSKLEIVKESSIINDKEVEGGVKLHQVSTLAYNDGIISESRLNDYVVSWFDYSANPSARIVNWTTSSIEDWSGGKATVLAEKYEETHPGYLVVGAVNGDFFHIDDNDEVMNLSMREGEMIKPYIWDALGIGVLGWTYDGKMISGIPTISDSMYLEVLNDNGDKISETTISSVNNTISDTGITLLSKDIEDDEDIKYDFTGMTVVELEYSLHRFSLDGNENNDRLFVKGTVTNVTKDLGSESVIRSGCIYLVAKDDSLNHIELGDNLRCQYHLTGEWKDVYNTTGYYAKILDNGNSLFFESSKYNYDNVVGDPYYINCKKNRTVIGQKPDGSTVLMTIEYRKDGNYGASYYECAEYLKSVGCINGWLLDGGGSTSMALRNSNGDFDLIAGGSDGHERSNGNAILLVVKDPGISPVIDKVSRFSATLNILENGSPFSKDVYDIKFEINGKVYDYNGSAVTVEDLEEDSKYEVTVHYKMKLENDVVLVGKKELSFETFAFSGPNVSFEVIQKSNTEMIITTSIRKKDGVEVTNFQIHQGENNYTCNPGDIMHITNLEPLKNYEFYASYDCLDPETGKTYHLTSKIFECSTLKEARPLVTIFKLVKHAGTVLEFEYAYIDPNNQVEEAYIEYFGNKIEQLRCIKSIKSLTSALTTLIL